MTTSWSDYFLTPHFDTFWRSRLADGESSICAIIGVGFDPRSLTAIKTLAQLSPVPIDCIALILIPPSELSEDYKKLELLTQENIDSLKKLENVKILAHQDISLKDEEGYLAGGRDATAHIHNLREQIAPHRDVLVDISGLPRTIFFPLVSFLCEEAKNKNVKNLHVVVTEDSALDSQIRSGEFGNPDYLYTFRPRNVDGDSKFIWLPVLSSSESERFEKIHNQIEKDCAEICPILPFPAKDLRKTDSILMQMHSMLFDRMYVSKNNLILCDEGTPFDIYRKIINLDDYYRETLSKLPELSNITTIVSPLASKMLSLGMLLAAIERGLAVSYAEAGSYQFDGTSLSVSDNVLPVEIWLTGEPYEI